MSLDAVVATQVQPKRWIIPHMNSANDSIEAKAERSVWAALKRLEAELDQEQAAFLLHRCTALALCAVHGHKEAAEQAYKVADELATLMGPK